MYGDCTKHNLNCGKVVKYFPKVHSFYEAENNNFRIHNNDFFLNWKKH